MGAGGSAKKYTKEEALQHQRILEEEKVQQALQKLAQQREKEEAARAKAQEEEEEADRMLAAVRNMGEGETFDEAPSPKERQRRRSTGDLGGMQRQISPESAASSSGSVKGILKSTPSLTSGKHSKGSPDRSRTNTFDDFGEDDDGFGEDEEQLSPKSAKSTGSQARRKSAADIDTVTTPMLNELKRRGSPADTSGCGASDDAGESVSPSVGRRGSPAATEDGFSRGSSKMTRQTSNESSASPCSRKGSNGRRQSSDDSGMRERADSSSKGTNDEAASKARRASIHAHRVSCLISPADLSGLTSPTSPGARSNASEDLRTASEMDPDSPKSGGGRRNSSSSHHRRGSASRLGPESLAVLEKSKEEAENAKNVKDDDLFGFLVGDKVTPQGGPDAHGPWEKLGDAVVIEKGKKKGFIDIKFEKTGDVFTLKAANLTNITDPLRSGSHVRNKKGDNGKKMRACVLPAASFQEAVSIQNDPLGGLKAGDHVGIGTGGEGIIVKEGNAPGIVLVRFGDLGIRSVPLAQLTKMRKQGQDGAVEAMNAASVDSTSRKRFTLSLNEASGVFNEKTAFAEDRAAKEMMAAKEKEVDADKAKEESVETDPLKGLKVGDYVLVTDANPIWQDFGQGCIRSLGPKAGTFNIQFDSGGDTFCIHADQLKKVQAPERRFRKLGQKIIPETEQGKARHEARHKKDH